MRTLEQVIASLSPAKRAKVLARAREIVCYTGLMADEKFERGMRMVNAAVRLGDRMSGQIADRSLRLRRAKRAIESAVQLLEAGRVQAAHDLLKTALAVWEPD